MDRYKQDFYGWTQDQVTLLRQQDFDHLDIDHLIEEIESMGRAERRQLGHRLEVLLMRLLKWQFQPELRGRSWQLTIIEQRRRITKLLRDNPSLRSDLPALLVDAYEDSLFNTMRETGLSIATFPESCPYTQVQVLDHNWLPDGESGRGNDNDSV